MLKTVTKTTKVEISNWKIPNCYLTVLNSVCQPQLLNSCTLIAPKSKTQTKLLPRYNQLSSIKFDQTYQLELLTTVAKTARVEISTLS